MSKSLKKRLKTSIFSTGMLASILIGILMLSWQNVFNYISYYSKYGVLPEKGGMFLEGIYASHTHSGYDMFAPIFAVLPAAILFCDDYNSGYLKNILTRTEKKKYIKETLICSSISGGLAIFIPTCINTLIHFCIEEKNILELKHFNNILDETVFANIQYIWEGLLIAILILVLSFLFGAIWSNIGLVISSIKPNRYVALATPFAIYFAIHLIFYRIGSLLFLSPMNMLMPLVNFLPNIYYPFLYEIILLIATYIIFYFLGKGRLNNV